ncbi:protein sex-lethal-like isoform X2 [Schistocerca nitens]|uniref:protein sex-lethal-like isoform X2 n=1 Tax=Schistocerca nitens TaxID=7011 RepID=UPI002117D57C|nr:protein sex-lethal-like isoform X2 [Schistocerca nitens]
MDAYPRTLHYVNQDTSWTDQGSSKTSSRNGQLNIKSMADQQGKRDDSKTNLIINYLPQTLTEKELYNMFVTIGPVESCRVMKHYKTGYSYGFGFVNYQKPEDAIRAIATLNGFQVQNKRLKVSFARPSGYDIKDTNLYVTNLPRNITEEYLDKLFGKYGTIVQKNLLKDKITGLPRGVAFVRYDRREEAQLAINNLNGVIPEDGTEPLTVKVAEEHGKQKAAYYAGWQAGFNQSRGSTTVACCHENTSTSASSTIDVKSLKDETSTSPKSFMLSDDVTKSEILCCL